MNTFPEIITKCSVLTHMSEDELCVLKEIFDDAETKRFLSEIYELLDTPDGLQNFVATFDFYTQNDEGYLWGVKHSDELVGFVAVMDLSYIPTLFYATHPNHRSKGYMKNALYAVLDYLSSKAIRMISTDVYKENSISITILQQLGFCVCKEDDKKVYMSKAL